MAFYYYYNLFKSSIFNVVHTQLLKGFCEETNIELFSFNKKTSTALESERAPNPPLSPRPTHTVGHNMSRQSRAGPSAPTKMLLHYETRGTSTRTWGWEGGSERDDKKSSCVGQGRGRGGSGGGGTVGVAVVTGEVVVVVSARVNHVVCVGEFSPSQKKPFNVCSQS